MGDRTQARGRWRIFLAWFAIAAVAAPFTILLHELGHFGTYAAFGFPGLELRPASISFDDIDLFQERLRTGGRSAAAEIYPPWQAAIGAAGGPVVTLLLIIAACYAVRRVGPHPLAVAIGFAAPVRFLVGVVYLLISLFKGSGTPRFDEFSVAALTGIPLNLLLALEAVLLIATWLYLIRSLPSGARALRLLALVGGIAVGIPA